jgi:hypothetical protein
MITDVIYDGNKQLYRSKIELRDRYNTKVFADQWIRENTYERYKFRNTLIKDVDFEPYTGTHSSPFDVENSLFESCKFNIQIESGLSNSGFRYCDFWGNMYITLENGTHFDWCSFNNLKFDEIDCSSNIYLYGCVFDGVKFKNIKNWSSFNHCAFINCDFNETRVDWFMLTQNHLSIAERDNFDVYDVDILATAHEMSKEESVSNNEIISFLQL